MSEVWRLLDLGVIDPYDGEPVREILLTAFKRGLIPSTLCFNVLGRSAWIGRKTNLEESINLEYCRRENIPILRGIQNGGGGLNDGDMLQCNLVSRGKPLHDDVRRAENFIAKALRLMGLEACHKLKSNDVLLNGKKVSGTGTLLLPSGLFLSTGTVALDFNYDLCDKVLLPVSKKFVNKEAENHREWVTTLKTAFGREVSYSEVVSAIKKVFESELQVGFEVSTSLTDIENQMLGGLREKYKSEVWLKTGRWSPVKDYGI